MDSFVQGTGFIATQLQYTAALRNVVQIALVPLDAGAVKDWRRTMLAFSDGESDFISTRHQHI